ncbi:MAG TPA: ATP-binding protein [Actinomycetes bacterium]
MEIALSLSLPRDAESIQVARHFVRHALAEVGVTEDCTHDVELALSEACTNVLLHASPGDEYDVRVEIDEQCCELRVVDVGQGFDPSRPRRLVNDEEAERGRGLGLMAALVDKVQFVSKPADGTVVHLQKNLDYRDDSFGGRLVEPG